MSELIAARMNKGLSIRRAALKMEISRGTLERAERGEGIHPATAKTIADFYGVKVTDLWPVNERSAA